MIAIYSRRNLDYWSKSAREFLVAHGQDCILVTEYKTSYSYSLADEYNDRMRNFGAIVHALTDSECDDIIYRCRVLRSVKRPLALSMIYAMYYSINKFIIECNIKTVLMPRVDSYVLDLIERIARIRGLKVIALWRSAFIPGKFFIASRGKFDLLNIKGSLSDDFVKLKDLFESSNFKGTSLKSNSLYSRAHNIKTWVYLKFRDILFQAVRLNKRFKYDYGYMANQYIVHESKSSFLVFFDKKVRNLEKLDIPEKSKCVYFSLQVNPEATIDYYSENHQVIDVSQFVSDFVNKLTSDGYTVLIKDHPNMSGKRDFKNFVFKDASKIHIIDPMVPTNTILQYCKFVFTWSGTVSIEAFLNGNISIAICPLYKIIHPNFIIFDGVFDNLLKQMSAVQQTEPITLAKDAVYNQIADSLYDGYVYEHNKKMIDADVCIESLILKEVIK